VHDVAKFVGKKELDYHLRLFFDRCTVLRELCDEHPWVIVMVTKMLLNKPGVPKNTKKKLDDFTERDAARAGRALKLCILSNATPTAAVDQWAFSIPAIGELEAQHRWFRPFVDAIVKHLQSVADLNLKMRLFSGAFLSIFDMASDV
jgi:hypothetical protein